MQSFGIQVALEGGNETKRGEERTMNRGKWQVLVIFQDVTVRNYNIIIVKRRAAELMMKIQLRLCLLFRNISFL